MKVKKSDVKKVFLKKGTCSNTLCFLLNREFGYIKDIEERASDLLAGGLMSQGCQCGMLWGSSLAAGAEAYRRFGASDEAKAMSISATQNLLESFKKRTNTHNCRTFTNYDFRKKSGLILYAVKTMFLGFVNSPCFNLAEKWAPEAIQAVSLTFSKKAGHSQRCVSCASEVAKKLGATEEQVTMVAGFAGGLGLSGNACGALGAAIWMRTIAWCKEHPGKNPPYFSNKSAKEIFSKFNATTGSKLLCYEICGQNFKSAKEHSEFIKKGGCDKLIHVLAAT